MLWDALERLAMPHIRIRLQSPQWGTRGGACTIVRTFEHHFEPVNADPIGPVAR